MDVAAIVSLIFLFDTSFLFMGYSSHFLWLRLPYHIVIILCVGFFSLIAAFASYSAIVNSKIYKVKLLRDIVATYISL